MTNRSTPSSALQSKSWIEWITLFTSLLLLGAYIAWSLAMERNAVEARERDRLSTQARVVDVHVAQQLAAIQRVLTNLRHELPYWHQQPSGMSSANQRLTAFSEALIGVRTLGLFDATGTLIASNQRALLNRNFSDQDYFQNARQNPDTHTLYVSAPFISVSNKWVIMLSMCIITEDGKFDGLVAAALDADRFYITLDSINYATDMWSAIAHGDGIQFMMVPQRPGQAGMNLAKPGSFFTRHRESGKRENILSGLVYSTGEYRLMALRTIQPPQLLMDKPLIVAVGRDLNTISLRWEREAYFRAALFLLLVITTSFALYRLQCAHRNAQRSAATAATAINRKNEELEALNEQLRSLALVDGLTGVANRRRFDEIFDHEWNRCRRENECLALLMFDIDHFKDYNDHYGHQAGDKCLREVARTLQQGFERSSDLIARYGGEEFVGLLPNTDLAGAIAKAESLRHMVESLNIPHGHSSVATCVTTSVGVAAIQPGKYNVPHSLITEADEALYTAKHFGRNRVYPATAEK